MRLSLPYASIIDGPISEPISYRKITVLGGADAAIITSAAAAMTLPLWAAFEVIYWVGNYFLA